MKSLIAAAFLFGVTAFAANPAPKIGPQLTATEKIALQSVIADNQKVQQEQQQIQQKLGLIEADIARTHQGFHLDLNTLALAPNPKVPDAPLPPKKK